MKLLMPLFWLGLIAIVCLGCHGTGQPHRLGRIVEKRQDADGTMWVNIWRNDYGREDVRIGDAEVYDKCMVGGPFPPLAINEVEAVILKPDQQRSAANGAKATNGGLR